jgi:hypothetical protein
MAGNGRRRGRSGIAVKKLLPFLITFLVLALLAGWQWVGVAAAQSQPEFEIRATEENLEQEYRDELDKWMLRAYEGDRDAQFKVGVLFTNDQFGPPDFEQAVYWYKQAARQGHVLAQYNLGHQYLTGVGVEKNESSAMQWWLEAAKQDHALAQFNVGRAYYLGIGLPEDQEQSRYWFERAAFNQEPKSIDILKQLGWYEGEISALPEQPEIGVTQQISVGNAGPVDQEGTSEIRRDDRQPELSSKILPITADEEPEPTTIIEPATPTPNVVSDAQSVPESAPRADSSDPVRTDRTTVKTSSSKAKNPIALYTDPKVRSVLIAILDDREGLNLTQRGSAWSVVRSSSGFPVWVSADFLAVNGATGRVTGQAVNARSVPIITNGTVVGKLNKDETVQILDRRKNWYRVKAPARFTAWVKTSDFDREQPPVVAQRESKARTENKQPGQWEIDRRPAPVSPVASTAPVTVSSSNGRPINDNEWLFGQPSGNYTLQLASFDDLNKVNEFESRAKFINNPELHRFTARGKAIEWTYFLYGSYPDRAAAEAAKEQINQKRAWVRTFGRLQQNRCVAWKTQLPTPSELNRYCTQ